MSDENPNPEITPEPAPVTNPETPDTPETPADPKTINEEIKADTAFPTQAVQRMEDLRVGEQHPAPDEPKPAPGETAEPAHSEAPAE